MNSGMITTDSEFGAKIGFTSDKFSGYLWRQGDRIIISLIESRIEGRGDLSRLFEAIERAGYRVAVPTPSARMQGILEHKGFAPHLERDPVMGVVEIWEK